MFDDGVPLKGVGSEHLRESAVKTQHIQDETILSGDLASSTKESFVPVGALLLYGGTSAPGGYLLCDGTAVSRTTYAALFGILGTAYGAGDGSTTFNLPDLRQRFPLGKAASGTGATLGGTGGAIDHVHALDSSTSFAKIFIAAATPFIRMFRKTTASWNHNNESTTALTVAANSAAQTLGAELGGNSDIANPPFQTVNFIVKT